MRNSLQRLLISLLWACALAYPSTGLSQSLAMDAWLQALREQHIESVEGAIGVLPADMRSNYALMFESRSLQSARPAYPRAVLFGTTGEFIVTFNGDASQRGYDAIEVMQFDPRTNAFHFRELTFPGAGKPPELTRDNPARCTACHGTPARPIWDTPPTWPGAYGERYRVGLSKSELQGLQSFLQLQKEHPRYRWLIDAPRLAERATYVASARDAYNGSTSEPPNARLSALLSSLNARSLLATISQGTGYESYRFALLGAADGQCGSMMGFFPTAMQSEVAQAFEQYSHDSAALAVNQAHSKQYRGERHGAGNSGGIDALDPTGVRFIATRLMGVADQRWSLALEQDSFDLVAPEGSLTLENLLFQQLANRTPALRSLRTYRNFTTGDPYCSELRRLSVQELMTQVVPDGLTAHPSALQAREDRSADHAPAEIGLCANCHTGQVGPALPFSNTHELAMALKTEGYPHGRLIDEILYRLSPQSGPARMPRGVNLDEARRQELESYFLTMLKGDSRTN